MKKGKIFTKSQITVFVMVLALGAAVWLNMRYSSGTKYLGETKYVSENNKSQSVVQTSAKTSSESSDYIKTAKQNREKSLTEIEESIEEILKSANLTDAEKQNAKSGIDKLSNRIAAAQNIESLLEAKGFKESVAVLSDDSASVVIKATELTTEQTIQIQDIVTEQTDIKLSNIKIITVK